MKNCFTCICIIMFAMGLRAQTNELIIKNSNKGLYVDHKVTPKENFYSIGRLFNVHPKHIASFNSLDMAKGLALGQILRIPLTDTNFNQKSEKGQPVYYMAGNGENLHRVSTNNNNVLIENLRQWNNLFTDNIANGSKLIVGYLQTKETLPVGTNNPPKVETVNNLSTETSKEPVKIAATADPGIKKEVAKDGREELKKEEKKEAPKNEQPNQEIVTKQQAKKDEPSKEVTPVKQEIKSQGTNQGYFKTSFDQQIKQHPASKEQTMTSGVFKTVSGWTDAKFYLLMDGLEPGTIVRITNPANNKMIYAKLLGEMTGQKQNQGVNIRISNAAASALDVAETEKFTVKLNY